MNGDYELRIHPGEVITHGTVPLDQLLLDHDVGQGIKNNHPELLEENLLLEDEVTLHLFFGEQRDSNLIAALF